MADHGRKRNRGGSLKSLDDDALRAALCRGDGGWRVETRARRDGASAGRDDRYFRPPTEGSKLLRSLPEVRRWLAAAQGDDGEPFFSATGSGVVRLDSATKWSVVDSSFYRCVQRRKRAIFASGFVLPQPTPTATPARAIVGRFTNPRYVRTKLAEENAAKGIAGFAADCAPAPLRPLSEPTPSVYSAGRPYIVFDDGSRRPVKASEGAILQGFPERACSHIAGLAGANALRDPSGDATTAGGTPSLFADGQARRSSAGHLIATKALRRTATAWNFIVAQCSANP